MHLVFLILCFFPKSIWKKKSMFFKGRDHSQQLVHWFSGVFTFQGGPVAPLAHLPGQPLLERGGVRTAGTERIGILGPCWNWGDSSKHCGTSTRITRNNSQTKKRLPWIPAMSYLPSVPKSLCIYQVDLCCMPHSYYMLGLINCLKIKAYPAV